MTRYDQLYDNFACSCGYPVITYEIRFLIYLDIVMGLSEDEVIVVTYRGIDPQIT